MSLKPWVYQLALWQRGIAVLSDDFVRLWIKGTVMNEQNSFEEEMLRVSHDVPGPEVRHQILSLVNAELRTHRKDRRVAIFSMGLLLFAVAINTIVGQHETERLARWYSYPSRELWADKGIALAVNTKGKDTPEMLVQNYFVAVYPSLLQPKQCQTSVVEKQHITEYIRQLSGTNGGT